MSQAIITFDAFGGVEAMHRDEYPIDFLGKMTITRASEIVFDEETQKWGIVLVDPKLCAPGTAMPEATKGYHGYDIARAVEVAWLDACRLDGVMPLSDMGLYHLNEARRAA